jgi:hypothetical protein
MTVVICRSLVDSGSVEGTLALATISLAAFAVLGGILGHLAQNTIDESVRTRLEQQLVRRAAPAAPQEAVA